jgi:hypothetical protein
VNHHIARIDQHPVRLRHAFDAHVLHARFLQLAHDVIGQRADMARRPPGGDDKHVREGRFSLDVERDNLFGFVVFERRQNHLRGGVDIDPAGRSVGGARRSSGFGGGRCAFHFRRQAI